MVDLVSLPPDVLEKIADILWFDVIAYNRIAGRRCVHRSNWAAANYLYKLAASDIMLAGRV